MIIICLQKSNNHSTHYSVWPINQYSHLKGVHLDSNFISRLISSLFLIFHRNLFSRYSSSFPCCFDFSSFFPFAISPPPFEVLTENPYRNRENSVGIFISSKYLFGIFWLFAVHFYNDLEILWNWALFLFSSQFGVCLDCLLLQTYKQGMLILHKVLYKYVASWRFSGPTNKGRAQIARIIIIYMAAFSKITNVYFVLFFRSHWMRTHFQNFKTIFRLKWLPVVNCLLIHKTFFI